MVRKAPYAVLAAVLAGPAASQDSGWDYALTFSGWFSGLESEVDTPFGDVRTELDFSDVWEILDLAFFGSFEARTGRWGFIGDLIYSDLAAEEGRSDGRLFTEADVGTTLTVLTGYAAYRVVDDPAATVDLAGGVRWYDLDLDVGLSGGLAGRRDFSSGDSWVDPVIAARARFPLSQRWFASGFADVGGFGIGDASELSWQVYASVGYQFNERWFTQLGYRFLSSDRELKSGDSRLEFFGPILGVTARF